MGLKRSKPMKRGGGLQRSGRIRRRSKKTERFYRDERVPLTKRMLEDDTFCELGRAWVLVDPTYSDCQLHAIGLHELRKRSAGGSLTNPANLRRTCGPCNSRVEDSPDLAHEAGIVVRRDDPSYDALGEDGDIRLVVSQVATGVVVGMVIGVWALSALWAVGWVPWLLGA